jgi:transglutaminase-like putative cysteine protease
MRLRIHGNFWRRLILERVHRILALIIVLQLIQCFTDYWWEETFSIINGVLIVTAASEALFTKRFWLRFSFQVTSAVLFIIWKLPYEWAGWPESWRVWDNVRGFIVFHAEQLDPFIELAVGVVLAVHVLAWLGSTRTGAITVVVLSILVMASVDSFFPLELWHNIAWIVTTGLAWLVILHLRQLQARHPDSWEALAERPLDIAFPAIVIITIVLLTGIFMPRAPVFLEDPYTIWTEAQGREVPAFAGEGGVQKVSISGSKGSSLSGYSRDDRKIGGGFEFDYSPVMTITTSRRSYWRGETKAIYTGKGWADSKNPELIPYSYSNEEDLPVLPERNQNIETIEVVQTVSVQRKDKIPVLFAAGPASSLGDLKSDNNAGLRWNPEEWELRWSKPARVQSYSVVSKVAVLDEEVLRKAVPAAESTIDTSAYLQLPDTLPERVHQLALEQTKGLTNDYDRAKKLEQYLKETYPYTNTPDLTRQTNRTNGDIVDAFLFEIQEGYCDYYSTSFVVMARSIGLPARWVKGYSTGFDPEALERVRYGGGAISEAPDPTGAGTYTVRNADAHSWAEVYFDGYGWMPFEPTSGFSVPQPFPKGEEYVPDSNLAVDTNPGTEGLSGRNIDWLVPAGAAGVIVIILSLVYMAYRSKRFGKLWDLIRHRGNTPNQRIVREMEKLLSFLQRKGLRRETNETIRETFTRWSGKFSSLQGEFDGALTNFEQARYGHDSGNERVLHAFIEAAANIRKAL